MATPLLTDTELANKKKISVHTLRADRQRKRRIPFFKIGRSVRYDEDRVDAALAKLEMGGEAEHRATTKPATTPSRTHKRPSRGGSTTKRRS